MTCEQAQQLLFELESPAQGPEELLAHLEGCTRCRAVAERVHQADRAVAERVERFVGRGDFQEEWARARQTAAAHRRRPTFRYFLAVSALAAALMLVLRVTLLPEPRLPDPPQPAPQPAPLPSPVEPTEPVAAPEPAPPPARVPVRPAPKPAPRPAPRTTEPRPVAAPAPPAALPQPTEPPASPEPPAFPEPTVSPVSPEPTVSPAPSTRVVLVQLDPALTAQRGTLTCPSGRLRGSRSGDQLRFDAVPYETCQLELGGTTLSGVDSSSGRYRVALSDGRMVLQRD
jgi:hypothetical protein